MRRAPPAYFYVVSEEVVRRTAEILGAQCAAHQALTLASEHRARGEEVVFVQIPGSIIVVPRSLLDREIGEPVPA